MKETILPRPAKFPKYSPDLSLSTRRLFAFVLGTARFKDTKIVRLDDGQASRQAMCHERELHTIQKRLTEAGLLIVRQGSRGASYQLYSLYDDSRYFSRKMETDQTSCVI